MKDISMQELKNTATQMRMKVIDMIYKAQSGHPGGSLSAADFVTACYFKYMNLDPKNPRWEDRDRMVLSKGHVCPIQYACLAAVGFFPESVLDTLRKEGSMLQRHPSMNRCPGIDISTGSLGQGLSAAAGMAKGAKFLGKDINVYSILGDGELAEGQIWEATMFAAHYQLDNLCIIVDLNGLQIDGCTKDVMNTAPVDKKFEAFGCDVVTINGHSFPEIEQAMARFHANHGTGKPTAVLMNTIKGKGVSYMENQVGWHGKAPNDEEYAQAMAELAAARKAIEEG